MNFNAFLIDTQLDLYGGKIKITFTFIPHSASISLMKNNNVDLDLNTAKKRHIVY